MRYRETRITGMSPSPNLDPHVPFPLKGRVVNEIVGDGVGDPETELVTEIVGELDSVGPLDVLGVADGVGLAELQIP